MEHAIGLGGLIAPLLLDDRCAAIRFLAGLCERKAAAHRRGDDRREAELQQRIATLEPLLLGPRGRTDD